MTLNSTDDSSSILEGGRVKPGIYKIQNLYHQNYLDIAEHSRELYCFPARDLENGRGLWEINHLGVGYTIRRVERGKPDQFCNPMNGVNDEHLLYVSPYAAAWRIEVVNEDAHRGFEYVRIYWGTTKRLWDLCYTFGKQVLNRADDDPSVTWRIWKLIPAGVEGAPIPSQSSISEMCGSGSLPPYHLDADGQCPTRTQHSEREQDDFGTMVTEVTTITTRKRYRVEGA